MGMTIFNTPILSPILRLLSIIILKLIGWRAINNLPHVPRKAVMIAAPHTSNWDFALFLLIVFALKVNLNVLIKHTIFIFPIGIFLRYCGAIPVDRRAAGARVTNTAKKFQENDDVLLLITPEGTRSARTEWKTGFYRIAEAAGVPIVIAYVDVKKKCAGLEYMMAPSGDVEADMAEIYAFYDDKNGVVAKNYASPNRPAPDEQ
jgi:1-acyl-sn-glycerol-3-phosphate acyltransferase